MLANAMTHNDVKTFLATKILSVPDPLPADKEVMHCLVTTRGGIYRLAPEIISQKEYAEEDRKIKQQQKQRAQEMLQQFQQVENEQENFPIDPMPQTTRELSVTTTGFYHFNLYRDACFVTECEPENNANNNINNNIHNTNNVRNSPNKSFYVDNSGLVFPRVNTARFCDECYENMIRGGGAPRIHLSKLQKEKMLFDCGTTNNISCLPPLNIAENLLLSRVQPCGLFIQHRAGYSKAFMQGSVVTFTVQTDIRQNCSDRHRERQAQQEQERAESFAILRSVENDVDDIVSSMEQVDDLDAEEKCDKKDMQQLKILNDLQKVVIVEYFGAAREQIYYPVMLRDIAQTGAIDRAEYFEKVQKCFKPMLCARSDVMYTYTKILQCVNPLFAGPQKINWENFSGEVKGHASSAEEWYVKFNPVYEQKYHELLNSSCVVCPHETQFSHKINNMVKSVAVGATGYDTGEVEKALYEQHRRLATEGPHFRAGVSNVQENCIEQTDAAMKLVSKVVEAHFGMTEHGNKSLLGRLREISQQTSVEHSRMNSADRHDETLPSNNNNDNNNMMNRNPVPIPTTTTTTKLEPDAATATDSFGLLDVDAEINKPIWINTFTDEELQIDQMKAYAFTKGMKRKHVEDEAHMKQRMANEMNNLHGRVENEFELFVQFDHDYPVYQLQNHLKENMFQVGYYKRPDDSHLRNNDDLLDHDLFIMRNDPMMKLEHVEVPEAEIQEAMSMRKKKKKPQIHDAAEDAAIINQPTRSNIAARDATLVNVDADAGAPRGPRRNYLNNPVQNHHYVVEDYAHHVHFVGQIDQEPLLALLESPDVAEKFLVEAERNVAGNNADHLHCNELHLNEEERKERTRQWRKQVAQAMHEQASLITELIAMYEPIEVKLARKSNQIFLQVMHDVVQKIRREKQEQFDIERDVEFAVTARHPMHSVPVAVFTRNVPGLALYHVQNNNNNNNLNNNRHNIINNNNSNQQVQNDEDFAASRRKQKNDALEDDKRKRFEQCAKDTEEQRAAEFNQISLMLRCKAGEKHEKVKASINIYANPNVTPFHARQGAVEVDTIEFNDTHPIHYGPQMDPKKFPVIVQMRRKINIELEQIQRKINAARSRKDSSDEIERLETLKKKMQIHFASTLATVQAMWDPANLTEVMIKKVDLLPKNTRSERALREDSACVGNNNNSNNNNRNVRNDNSDRDDGNITNMMMDDDASRNVGARYEKSPDPVDCNADETVTLLQVPHQLRQFCDDAGKIKIGDAVYEQIHLENTNDGSFEAEIELVISECGKRGMDVEREKNSVFLHSTYANHLIIAGAFPVLYVFGPNKYFNDDYHRSAIFGPDIGFPINLILSVDYIKHTLCDAESKLSQNYSLLFLLHNQRQFSQVMGNIRSNPAAIARFDCFIKKHQLYMENGQSKNLAEVLTRMYNEMTDNPLSTNGIQIRKAFQDMISISLRGVSFSRSEKSRLFLEYKSALAFYGPASFHLTLSPLPSHMEEAYIINGMFRGCDAPIQIAKIPKKIRDKIFFQDAVGCAKFFSFIVDFILHEVLKIPKTSTSVIEQRNSVAAEVGALGDAYRYKGTVETQQRGLLHIHVMVWTKTSNEDIMQKMTQALRTGDHDLSENLMKYLDRSTECTAGDDEFWHRARDSLIVHPVVKTNGMSKEQFEQQVIDREQQLQGIEAAKEIIFSSWSVHVDDDFNESQVNDKLFWEMMSRNLHLLHVPSCFTSDHCRHGFPAPECKKTMFYKMRIATSSEVPLSDEQIRQGWRLFSQYGDDGKDEEAEKTTTTTTTNHALPRTLIDHANLQRQQSALENAAQQNDLQEKFVQLRQSGGSVQLMNQEVRQAHDTKPTFPQKRKLITAIIAEPLIAEHVQCPFHCDDANCHHVCNHMNKECRCFFDTIMKDINAPDSHKSLPMMLMHRRDAYEVDNEGKPVNPRDFYSIIYDDRSCPEHNKEICLITGSNASCSRISAGKLGLTIVQYVTSYLSKYEGESESEITATTAHLMAQSYTHQEHCRQNDNNNNNNNNVDGENTIRVGNNVETFRGLRSAAEVKQNQEKAHANSLGSALIAGQATAQTEAMFHLMFNQGYKTNFFHAYINILPYIKSFPCLAVMAHALQSAERRQPVSQEYIQMVRALDTIPAEQQNDRNAQNNDEDDQNEQQEIQQQIDVEAETCFGGMMNSGIVQSWKTPNRMSDKDEDIYIENGVMKTLDSFNKFANRPLQSLLLSPLDQACCFSLHLDEKKSRVSKKAARTVLDARNADDGAAIDRRDAETQASRDFLSLKSTQIEIENMKFEQSLVVSLGQGKVDAETVQMLSANNRLVQDYESCFFCFKFYNNLPDRFFLDRNKAERNTARNRNFDPLRDEWGYGSLYDEYVCGQLNGIGSLRARREAGIPVILGQSPVWVEETDQSDLAVLRRRFFVDYWSVLLFPDCSCGESDQFSQLTTEQFKCRLNKMLAGTFIDEYEKDLVQMRNGFQVDLSYIGNNHELLIGNNQSRHRAFTFRLPEEERRIFIHRDRAMARLIFTTTRLNTKSLLDKELISILRNCTSDTQHVAKTHNRMNGKGTPFKKSVLNQAYIRNNFERTVQRVKNDGMKSNDAVQALIRDIAEVMQEKVIITPEDERRDSERNVDNTKNMVGQDAARGINFMNRPLGADQQIASFDVMEKVATLAAKSIMVDRAKQHQQQPNKKPSQFPFQQKSRQQLHDESEQQRKTAALEAHRKNLETIQRCAKFLHKSGAVDPNKMENLIEYVSENKFYSAQFMEKLFHNNNHHRNRNHNNSSDSSSNNNYNQTDEQVELFGSILAAKYNSEEEPKTKLQFAEDSSNLGQVMEYEVLKGINISATAVFNPRPFNKQVFVSVMNALGLTDEAVLARQTFLQDMVEHTTSHKKTRKSNVQQQQQQQPEQEDESNENDDLVPESHNEVPALHNNIPKRGSRADKALRAARILNEKLIDQLTYFDLDKIAESETQKMIHKKAMPRALKVVRDEAQKLYEQKCGKAKHQPTKQQKAIGKAVIDSVYGDRRDDQKVFMMTGGPGTGKTFTSRLIVDTITAISGSQTVIQNTFTHAAAANLHPSAITMHSAFGIKVFGDDSQRILSGTRANEFIAATTGVSLVIIDEISMCSPTLIATVLNRLSLVKKPSVRSENGGWRVTFLLIGDFFQIPPVGSSMSLLSLLRPKFCETLNFERQQIFDEFNRKNRKGSRYVNQNHAPPPCNAAPRMTAKEVEACKGFKTHASHRLLEDFVKSIHYFVLQENCRMGNQFKNEAPPPQQKFSGMMMSDGNDDDDVHVDQDDCNMMMTMTMHNSSRNINLQNQKKANSLRDDEYFEDFFEQENNNNNNNNNNADDDEPLCSKPLEEKKFYKGDADQDIPFLKLDQCWQNQAQKKNNMSNNSDADHDEPLHNANFYKGDVDQDIPFFELHKRSPQPQFHYVNNNHNNNNNNNANDDDDDEALLSLLDNNNNVLHNDNHNNNNNNSNNGIVPPPNAEDDVINQSLMKFLDQCRVTGHFSSLSGGASTKKLENEFLYQFMTNHCLTKNDIRNGFCARSTIVTHDNKDRHMINLACSIQFALEHGLHVIDVKAPLCGSVLECLSEAERREAVRLLDPNRIVKFLKILCEFVQPGTGITRATEGFLYKIIFPITDAQAFDINARRGTGDFHDAVNKLDIEQRSPEAVLILLPRSCFYHDLSDYIENVQQQICPEINSDEWIVYPLVPQKIRWTDLMNSPSATLDLFAVGYPFTPACGVTFHKVIGRTLQKLGINPNSPQIRFSFILVALSRTQDHNGLKFLVPDNPRERDKVIGEMVDYESNERFRIDPCVRAWWRIVLPKISSQQELQQNGFTIDPLIFAFELKKCNEDEDKWNAVGKIRKDEEKRKIDEAQKIRALLQQPKAPNESGSRRERDQ